MSMSCPRRVVSFFGSVLNRKFTSHRPSPEKSVNRQTIIDYYLTFDLGPVCFHSYSCWRDVTRMKRHHQYHTHQPYSCPCMASCRWADGLTSSFSLSSTTLVADLSYHTRTHLLLHFHLHPLLLLVLWRSLSYCQVHSHLHFQLEFRCTDS